MSIGPLLFMLTCWTLVLSLTAWAFYRLLKAPPPDPEGPASGVKRRT